jgi:hypothetical protein
MKLLLTATRQCFVRQRREGPICSQHPELRFPEDLAPLVNAPAQRYWLHAVRINEALDILGVE